MAITATKPKAAATAFPAAKVEACLRDELVAAASTEAELHGGSWPADVAAKSAVSIHIDSLVVVEIVCAVEAVVGFELHESLVRAGGYWSVNEAIGHLMPRIEREWHKQKRGKS